MRVRGSPAAASGLAVAGLGLFASCEAPREAVTMWPPEDFRLEVQAFDLGPSGLRVRESFQVWADGLAVWREADTWLEELAHPIPIFDAVSAYELHPNSTRMLGRLLQRAGLFTSGSGQIDNRAASGRHVTVTWTALGGSGTVSSLDQDHGPLDRALRIINTFVPEGREIRYDGFSVGRDERRASATPAPREDAEAALWCHEELARRMLSDPGLQLERIALALAAGDRARARLLFEELERSEPRTLSGQALHDLDWEGAVVEPLRRLLSE